MIEAPASAEKEAAERLAAEDQAALAEARTRDATIVLPLIGLLLFTPPLIVVFTSVNSIGGVPIVVLYVFGTWTAVIIIAYFLSRRLLEILNRRPAPEEEQ